MLGFVYGHQVRQASAGIRMRSRAAALHAEFGEGVAYQMAEIYAQWGTSRRPLDWLETA